MHDLAGKKAYFPVESLVGLGHFNRAGKLVREMIKAGADVTVASGTFVDPQRFFNKAKLGYMTPYVFKTGGGQFYKLDKEGKRTSCPDFNEQTWIHERTNQHLNYMTAIKPDVVLTEFWPFDRKDLNPEMFAMLTTSKDLNDQRLCVASVRDVIDPVQNVSEAEGKLRLEDREESAIQVLNGHYNGVLVHGDPRFIPLSETFSRVGDIKPSIVYTGYVINDLPQRVEPDASNGTLLVSCGSGVDGEEMILSFLTAWDFLLSVRHDHPEVASVTNRPIHIVCGPRFYQGAYNVIVPWAAQLAERSGYEIKVDRYRSDFVNLLSHAAFSVSLAGYNTTLETLALDVPALFVPKYALDRGKIWKSTEQEYRLERLRQQGIASYATPEETQNSRVFAERIANEFLAQVKSHQPRAKLDFSGAANTITTLSAMLKERSLAGSCVISLPTISV